MKGFHIEGMPQDKSNPFLLTEVREPLPGEDALHRYYYILSIQSNHAQKRVGSGGQILMDQFRAIVIQDTDVHRFRM